MKQLIPIEVKHIKVGDVIYEAEGRSYMYASEVDAGAEEVVCVAYDHDEHCEWLFDYQWTSALFLVVDVPEDFDGVQLYGLNA